MQKDIMKRDGRNLYVTEGYDHGFDVNPGDFFFSKLGIDHGSAAPTVGVIVPSMPPNESPVFGGDIANGLSEGDEAPKAGIPPKPNLLVSEGGLDQEDELFPVNDSVGVG